MLTNLTRAGLTAMKTISDPTNTELLIIGRRWWKKTGGVRYEITEAGFSSDGELIDFLNGLFEQSGSVERLDNVTWHAECAFTGVTTRARVHVVLPPVAREITVTVAIQRLDILPLDWLVDHRMLSNELAEFLVLLVRSRINFVIAGATGAGKTALLQALLSYVSQDERILLVEETPEVQLTQSNVVCLTSSSVRHVIDDISVEKFLGGFVAFYEQLAEETERHRAAGARVEREGIPALIARYLDNLAAHKGLLAESGRKDIGLGQIIDEAVRMRIDRVIVGETRGSEAVELFRAMNSGCPGSATTLHANSAEEVVPRLTTMAASHPQHFSATYISSLIASSLDVVIYLHLPADGVQRVDEVMEIGHQGVREGSVQHELLWRYDEVAGNWIRVGAPSDSLRGRITRSSASLNGLA